MKKILGVTKVLILIITLSVMFISTAYANNTTDTCTAACPIREYISDSKEVTFPISSANPIESVTVDGTFIGTQNDIRIIDISNISAIAARTAGRVGIPVDISTTGTVKEATIKFNYNSSLLGNTKPEDLAIGWYDEKQGRVVILDSKVDITQNMVSVVTNHFSEYILIDSAQWYAAWRKELVTGSRNTNISSQSNDIDIVFLIDNSGSMMDSRAINGKGNDNEGLRFTGVYNFITQLYNNDGFAVIGFDDSNRTLIDYTIKNSVTNWNSIKDKLVPFSNPNGTNISGAINKGVSLLTSLPSDRQATMKRIILLTDGKHESSSFDTSSYERAKQNNIIIDTIGLSYDGSKEYFDEALLMRIANETGGKYYFTLTQNIISTFDRIKNENIELNNSDMDTDGDGIPDDVEIGGMRNQFGEIIFTDPNNPDTDGDGLSDGEEVGQLIYHTDSSQRNRQNGVTEFVFYDMKSDPTKADTDGDGLLDPVDPRPWINDYLYPNIGDTSSNNRWALEISGDDSFTTHKLTDTTYRDETCDVKVDIYNNYIINYDGGDAVYDANNNIDMDATKEKFKIKDAKLYITVPDNVSIKSNDNSIEIAVLVYPSGKNNNDPDFEIKLGDIENGKHKSIDLEFTFKPTQDSGSYEIKFRATANNVDELNTTYKITYDSHLDTNLDTDGDGLPDEWEINGINGLDLKAMGASPNRKDIFIEVDYMPGFAPTKEELERVAVAFDKHGITLHIDAGVNSVNFPLPTEDIREYTRSEEIPYEEVYTLGFEDSKWEKTVSENFDYARTNVFHHCTFVNYMQKTVFDSPKDMLFGKADGKVGTTSQNFIIAKGTILLAANERSKVNEATVFDATTSRLVSRASQAVSVTFMHELGHTLGLRHGGDQFDKGLLGKETDYNHKPNYLSIMNYFFSDDGLLMKNKEIFSGVFYEQYKCDYSNYLLDTIDEKSVKESAGIDIAGKTQGSDLCTRYYISKKNTRRINDLAGVGINFNGVNGIDDEGYPLDLNGDGRLTYLTGFNDWDNLIFTGGSVGGDAIAIGDPIIIYDENAPEEITYGELMDLFIEKIEAETSDNTTSVPPTSTPSSPPTYTELIPITDPYVYEATFNEAPVGTILGTDYSEEQVDKSLSNAVIYAKNKTLKVGDPFVFMEGVTAKDDGGKGKDLTKKITLSGIINTKVPGKYIMHYKVKGQNGTIVSKDITITVVK